MGREFGRRVAYYRNRAGMSQPALGKRIGRSVAWVSQVERGVRQVDRRSVLDALAEALNVAAAELVDKAEPAAPASASGTIVSLALCSATALQTTVAGEAVPVDMARLRQAVDTAWQLAHESRYDDLGDVLGALIPDLEVAGRATTGTRRRQVLTATARAYHAAAAMLAKLGETAAAWVAADRAITAAEQANDPLLTAAGAFRLAIVFHSAQRYDLAHHAAQTAAHALDPLVTAGELDAVALQGALHLQLAVAAARSGDGKGAYAWLALAQQAADRLGVDRNDYDTEFGPTNVLLHEVSIAVELEDSGRALRAADNTNTQQLSPERQVRLLIDVARAHGQRDHTDLLITTLRAADDIAPQQVRGHPIVEETVRDALAAHPRDAALRELARDLDLTNRAD